VRRICSAVERDATPILRHAIAAFTRQFRAEAVRDYLVAQGVSASQVVSRGYGESQPIADNDSAEGRAQNRRVVMKVLRNPGSVEVKSEAQP
jgi:hypothetical protein